MSKDDKKKRQESKPLFHTIAEEKDSHRWVVIVMFLVVLFVTYIFWMQGK